MTLDFATMLAALALCLAAASPPVTDALQKCRVLSRLREAAVRLIERRFLVPRRAPSAACVCTAHISAHYLSHAAIRRRSIYRRLCPVAYCYRT